MSGAGEAYPDEVLVADLREWLPHQRWFAAKGQTIEDVEVVLRNAVVDEGDLAADHLLVRVSFTSAPAQIYQVPLGFRRRTVDELQQWAITGPDGPAGRSLFVYDGLRDQEILDRYAHSLATGGTHGTLELHHVPGSTIEEGLRGRALNAEQSNTSVVLGEQLLLKLFRRVTLGVNPDVELPLALGESGCRSIAPIRAWIEAEIDGVRTTLAMVQDFAANSADGWSMALGSVRDLMIEGDLRADEVGTDFAGESHRIGAAVADVHAHLASALGSSERPAVELAGEMTARLEAAAAEVPDLAEPAGAVRAAFEQVASLGRIPVHRIHGDLHLGQVLRTPERWLVIDFEGEPAKSLEERRRPDSPLRDVAGMMRSFDYAAHHSVDEGESTEVSSQRGFRAKEWAERNCAAFCEGYAAAAGLDPRESNVLLRAYELDKAVYEVVYEARNRPSWLRLPLDAIRRLTED
ncbi:phosphotransferase [Rhodococcus sp. Z13]|uniref:Phosphotransferase n=1 Tax=Rhodococcus sacchari TaxID=2962047 RepID=A0ACD4DHX8_9NOCA|nr:phosphotransferase [Rhodococcus sp. Z13]UYP19664.1 phosphotransferase [Rhodococcus sp. Z13]